MTPAKRKQLSETIFVVMVAFLPSFLSSWQAFTGNSSGSKQSLPDAVNWDSAYEYGIFYECLSIGLLWYVLRGRGESFFDLGFRFSWRDAGAGVALAAVVYLLNYGVQLGLITVMPSSVAHMRSANTNFIPSSFSPLFLIYLLLNPLREELIARGFLMRDTFSLSYSRTAAVAISVVVQTSYHLYQGWLPVLFIMLTFLVYSVYYVRTSRLLPVVVAHLIMDFVAWASYLRR